MARQKIQMVYNVNEIDGKARQSEWRKLETDLKRQVCQLGIILLLNIHHLCVLSSGYYIEIMMAKMCTLTCTLHIDGWMYECVYDIYDLVDGVLNCKQNINKKYMYHSCCCCFSLIFVLFHFRSHFRKSLPFWCIDYTGEVSVQMRNEKKKIIINNNNDNIISGLVNFFPVSNAAGNIF